MNDLSIVVVALDPLVRAGLVSLLRGQGITIVAEVADLEQIHLYEPEANAVIWDSSDDTLDEITHLPILALVPEDIETNAFPNVQGMLYRSSSIERIVHALYALAQGLTVYEPEFIVRQTRASDDIPTDLTARELEVLQRLAEGLSNKAIAKVLEISENTVKFHINALLDKFGVGSRTEVVIKAIQNGLVTI